MAPRHPSRPAFWNPHEIRWKELTQAHTKLQGTNPNLYFIAILNKTINTHAIAYKETSQSKLILQSFAR